METNEAILILETESQNLGVSIGRNTMLQNAMDLAVQQLQGSLTTKLGELEQTKAELATALATIAELTKPPVEPPPVEEPIITP